MDIVGIVDLFSGAGGWQWGSKVNPSEMTILRLYHEPLHTRHRIWFPALRLLRCIGPYLGAPCWRIPYTRIEGGSRR